MFKLRTPKGGIEKRKVYHCGVCDVNLYYTKEGRSPKSKHEKTAKHRAMALDGADYEKCPRCELNVHRNCNGRSTLSDHLKKKCAIRPEEFYIKKGGHSVCRELLELMELAHIPDEEVIKAREEREALLDKHPNSEEEAKTEEEPTTSKKVLFATAKELLALKPDEMEPEELAAKVKEIQSRVRAPTDPKPAEKELIVYLTFQEGKEPLIQPYVGQTEDWEKRKVKHMGGWSREETVMVKVLQVRSEAELCCAENVIWSMFEKTGNGYMPHQELLFKKLPSGDVAKESMPRLRHLFAVEMVANLRKMGYECRL